MGKANGFTAPTRTRGVTTRGVTAPERTRGVTARTARGVTARELRSGTFPFGHTDLV